MRKEGKGVSLSSSSARDEEEGGGRCVDLIGEEKGSHLYHIKRGALAPRREDSPKVMLYRERGEESSLFLLCGEREALAK